MIRLADYIIQFLEKKRIDTVFTVSGGGSIFLCDALYKAKKIKYVACHHEQAVAYATEGYARLKKSQGVAIITTGPGGTNSVSGLVSSWIDSVPVIFISGQVYLNQTIGNKKVRQVGVQEFNIIDMVEKFTKYSKLVDDPNDILYHLEKAFECSISGRPGPVWLDIPADIQNAKIDPKKLNKYKSTPIKKKNNIIDSKIRKVANLFNKFNRPIIHFGHGVRISESEKLAKKIINRHNIPFALTWNASDLIESSNKNYIGRPGAFAERGSNFIIQNCNLYISIGTRLPFMVTGYNSKDFARKAYKVMVDIDNKELKNTNAKIDLKVNCDAKYFLKKLNEYLSKNIKIQNEWRVYCKAIRKKYPILTPEFKNQKKYVNSYYFINELSKILKEKDVIVTDMGLSFVGTHQGFKIKSGQRLYTNSGHAPMGWGLPAAVGSYYANKRNRVICLTGEGGLQMNIQELATVMHNKLPIKIFIYNNGGYLTIKQTQQLGFKNRIMGSNEESGLSFPNYRKIADSHGIKYFRINKNSECKKIIEKVLINRSPIICELMIDHEQEQMPKAINRRDKSGKTIATTFEDLYPFLEREEFKSNYLE